VVAIGIIENLVNGEPRRIMKEVSRITRNGAPNVLSITILRALVHIT
jgi:hypothetical protein